VYLPSTKVADQLEGEIRALEKSLAALRAAIAQANRGRDDTETDLGGVQRRLAAKTEEALPDDAAIRGRLDTAIDSAFAAARTALSARWTEIVELLTTACLEVDGELTAKRRAHGQALDEVERERQRERLAAG
jgi:chromosome segregation ATPase